MRRFLRRGEIKLAVEDRMAGAASLWNHVPICVMVHYASAV